MGKFDINPDQEEIFNMAVQFLRRLDEQFRIANYFSKSETLSDLYNWDRALKVIQRELYSKMTAGERKLASGFNKKLNKFREKKLRDREDYNGFANELDRHELFLRKVMEKHDLTTPKKADPTKAIGRT